MTKETGDQLAFGGLIASMVIMIIGAYKVGYAESDKNWRLLLVEKNLITLEVKTNHETNLHGPFIWIK